MRSRVHYTYSQNPNTTFKIRFWVFTHGLWRAGSFEHWVIPCKLTKRGWKYPLKHQEVAEGTPLKESKLGALPCSRTLALQSGLQHWVTILTVLNGTKIDNESCQIVIFKCSSSKHYRRWNQTLKKVFNAVFLNTSKRLKLKANSNSIRLPPPIYKDFQVLCLVPTDFQRLSRHWKGPCKTRGLPSIPKDYTNPTEKGKLFLEKLSA